MRYVFTTKRGRDSAIPIQNKAWCFGCHIGKSYMYYGQATTSQVTQTCDAFLQYNNSGKLFHTILYFILFNFIFSLSSFIQSFLINTCHKCAYWCNILTLTALLHRYIDGTEPIFLNDEALISLTNENNSGEWYALPTYKSALKGNSLHHCAQFWHVLMSNDWMDALREKKMKFNYLKRCEIS